MVPQAKQQSQLDDFAMSCAAACCPWQHATYLLRPGHPVKTESDEIIIRLLHWLMFEHLFLFNMTMKPVSFSEWTLLIPSQVRKFEKKERTLLIYHVSSYIPIYLQGIRYMIYDIEYIYIHSILHPNVFLLHFWPSFAEPRFDEESFQPGASMESFLGALIHSLCRAWQWRPAWEFMEKEVPKLLRN